MTETKKVIIFSVAYYPKFVGGAEVAVKEITDRLDPAEYEFHLLTLRLDKSLPSYEKIGNVSIYRLGFAGKMKELADSLRFPLHLNKYLYPFLSAWFGYKLSKKINFDLSWSIMANYSGFGALFFKWLKPKIPMLLTLQEGDPIEYITKESLRVRIGNRGFSVRMFMYPILKKIFEQADTLQAISTYLAKFGKSMGFKGEPIVVPNGVDARKFDIAFSQEEKMEIREGLKLKEDDIALVTTSRLVIKNGVGDVIKSLALLPQHIKFIIFGEGYLKPELQTLVKELGVEERVKFMGFLPHSQMPKMIKACDIFIRPSLSEGFGNSFIEAMAARVPVIATLEGGIADFLVNNITGYVCQKENPESIRDTVLRIQKDPNRQSVIDNAYKMAVEKYDWSLVASRMQNIFENIKK